MKENIFRKSLVVGIIVLLIGVGVHPVFAKDTIKTTSETLEDCGCQPVSNHNLNRLEKLSNRIEKLLNRAEIFTNITAKLSKNNPEISEKCEELSKNISKLLEMNDNLKSILLHQKYPSIICEILYAMDEMLENTFQTFFDLFVFFGELYLKIPIAIFLIPVVYFFFYMFKSVESLILFNYILMFVLDCPDFP